MIYYQISNIYLHILTPQYSWWVLIVYGRVVRRLGYPWILLREELYQVCIERRPVRLTAAWKGTFAIYHDALQYTKSLRFIGAECCPIITIIEYQNEIGTVTYHAYEQLMCFEHNVQSILHLKHSFKVHWRVLRIMIEYQSEIGRVTYHNYAQE